MCRDRMGGHSQCHCQVIEAYIRECSVVAGASISPHLQASWRYMTGCYLQQQPHAAPPAPASASLNALRQRRQQHARRRHK